MANLFGDILYFRKGYETEVSRTRSSESGDTYSP